jgi:hypothetical protein
MPVTQISDVVVPAEFTAYQVENSFVSTALFQSGVAVRNGEMAAQLGAGAEQFTVPFWADAGEQEADITSDDPTVQSVPLKITAAKQVVRKSFLHQSWSEMSLASELSGSDALARVQSRVQAYWDRQWERRLIATLQGVLFSNVINNAGDMVHDISGAIGAASAFSAEAVIDTAATLGDRLEDCKAIAMHSAIYTEALKNDLIEFIPQSQGLPIKTFRGLAVTRFVRRLAGYRSLTRSVTHIGGISLLIIDPIVTAVTGDMHKANDVRRSLQTIVDFAAECNCAVLGITHFAKSIAGKNSAERIIGSQAFAALARMVLVAAKEEESDRRVFTRAKSNNSVDTGGYSYSIEALTLNQGIVATRVVWGEALEGSSRSILATQKA